MAEDRSWRLVIDAAVVKAASPRLDSPDPCPRQCRELLDAVLQICHRSVLSPELEAEWKRHRSNYALSWQIEMFNQEKVIPCSLNMQEWELGRLILEAAGNDEEQRALAKDLHLVAAALNMDKIIISSDRRARNLFRRVARKVPEVGEISWASPLVDDGLLDWLESGNQPGSPFRLDLPPKLI